MEQVGTVAQVWRYPVKSFQGEPVDSLDLAPGGAVGDRTLAVVDPAAGKVLSAKRYADLLMASARLDERPASWSRCPTAASTPPTTPASTRPLSDWLGLDVRLEPPPVDGVFPMEMYTGMSDEDSPVFDWPGPPGTWLDLADAHWLTTASLAAIAGAHPGGEWDVRRFRPTALIETDRGRASPRRRGPRSRSARSARDVLMATPRCSMPSRAQPGLARDKAIGTTIRDANSNNLGVYAIGDAERNRAGGR